MSSPLLNVKARDLIPKQQPTSIGFKRHTDCHERMMVKFPDMAIFHSIYELYYAALLEGNPLISAYVPQPYLLQIGRKRYKPDFFLIDKGKKQVVELKPKGIFDDRKRKSLELFFYRLGIEFKVIANEEVMTQSRLAENWLTIIAQLTCTYHLETDRQEIEILEMLRLSPLVPLSKIIDPENRSQSKLKETALFRLLQRGLVRGNLDISPLDYQTEFSLCI